MKFALTPLNHQQSFQYQNSQIMHLNWNILALLLLIDCTFTQTCPQSIQIQSFTSSSICNFKYQKINQACSFRVCSLQSSRSTSASNTGWSQCFSQCCSSIQLSQSDSIAKLQQCQSINKYNSNLLIGLSIGLTFSFIVLVALIFLCCKKQSCPLYKCRAKYLKCLPVQNPKGMKSLPSQVPVTINELTLSQIQDKSQHLTRIDVQCQKFSMQKLLNFDLTKNIRLMKSKCSICLEFKPECHLTCGHYFHVKCIGAWLSQHKNCASCGTKDLKYVHIFCASCREKLQIYSISKFKSQLKKSPTFYCKNCDKNHLKSDN